MVRWTRLCRALGICLLVLIASAPGASAQVKSELLSSLPSSRPQPAAAEPAPGVSKGPTIVIGFLGGFVSRNDRVHGAVQFAERLRELYPTVLVETYENHRIEGAEKAVVAFARSARAGKLADVPGSEPRVILYGHSWGASAAVSLARKLERDGIPVLLTVQIDSIGSFGRNDSLIPANVAHAVNFYQRGGLLRGDSEIKAADPARTQILGNFRYDYAKHPVTCQGYPWWNHVFSRTHMEIECDPQIWSRVESLVRAELQPVQTQSNGGL